MLLVAAALVLGIATLLGAGGSGGQPARASTSASTSSPSPTTSSAPATSGVAGPLAPAKHGKAASAAPLIAPSGPCADDAVSVVPSVPKAAAGAPIVLHLGLEGTQPACTFAVSPQSLVVKITSGSDRVWSSQDCPSAVPTSTVVVRSGLATDVPVTWSGRRSDPTCSVSTGWALPGFYHVYAAVLGSSPTDVQFEVTLPTRPVITQTATPKPTPTPSATALRDTQGHPVVEGDPQAGLRGQGHQVRRRQRRRHLLTLPHPGHRPALAGPGAAAQT